MTREVCDGHFMAGKSLGFACFHGKRDEKYVSPQHVYPWPYCPLLTPVLTKNRNLLDHVVLKRKKSFHNFSAKPQINNYTN